MPFRFGVVTLTERRRRSRACASGWPTAARPGHGGRAARAQVVRQGPGADATRTTSTSCASRSGSRAGLYLRRPRRQRLRPLRAPLPCAQIERARRSGLNPLVANYGPALIDRARARRAVPRAAAVLLRRGARQPAPASRAAALLPDFAGFDFGALPRRHCGRRRASPRATPSDWSTPIIAADRPSGRRRPARDAGGGGRRLRPALVQAQGGRQRRRRRRAAAAHRRGARPHRRAPTTPRSTATSSTTRRRRRRTVAAHARPSRALRAAVRQRRVHRAADQAPGRAGAGRARAVGATSR